MRCPGQWILFDLAAVQVELLGAKAAMLALPQIPYQRSWAEELQQSNSSGGGWQNIADPGAEFTERELDGGQFGARSCNDISAWITKARLWRAPPASFLFHLPNPAGQPETPSVAYVRVG